MAEPTRMNVDSGSRADEVLDSLTTVKSRAVGLLELLSEALGILSQVDPGKSEKFSELVETFMKELSDVRQEVHGQILKLGADLRVEDQSRKTFLKADVSLQKLTFVQQSLRSVLREVAKVESASSAQPHQQRYPSTSMAQTF